MQALDLIEPGFRPLYEALCTTNKGEGTEHIFFEGQLVDEGLGKSKQRYNPLINSHFPQATTSHGLATLLGVIKTTYANL